LLIPSKTLHEKTSLFPEVCAAAGIPYDTLIDRLLKAALDRGRMLVDA
jgi:hypothetical protein